MKAIRAIALACCFAAAGDASAQATKPAAAPATKAAAAATRPAAAAPAALKRPFGLSAKQQRDAQRNAMRSVPDGGTCKMEDLIRFTLADGRLKSEWVGKIPNGQQRRFKIEGSDATWVVNRFNQGMNTFYSVSRFDFDAPDDDYWMITFSFQQAANATSIYAQGNDGNEVMRLFYNQQPTMVSLNLMGYENNRMKQIMNANAGDLLRLRNDHPEEVRKHLGPILRRITNQPILRPGPSDVYRVFSAIPADPGVRAKIKGLLDALGSPDPAERDAATTSLRKLGAAGALAALRFDPQALFPEQVNRLNDLITMYSRMQIEDPAESARDPNFLIDCFEDEDANVRAAAKAALEKALGRKVDFDVNAPAPKRIAAADKLRAKLNADDKAKETPAAKDAVKPANAPANNGVRVLRAPNAVLKIGG